MVGACFEIQEIHEVVEICTSPSCVGVNCQGAQHDIEARERVLNTHTVPQPFKPSHNSWISSRMMEELNFFWPHDLIGVFSCHC